MRGGDRAQQLLVPPEMVIGQFFAKRVRVLVEPTMSVNSTVAVVSVPGWRAVMTAPGAARARRRRTPARAACRAPRRTLRICAAAGVVRIPQRRASSAGTRNGGCPSEYRSE